MICLKYVQDMTNEIHSFVESYEEALDKIEELKEIIETLEERIYELENKEKE